jgi:hypothetical protein
VKGYDDISALMYKVYHSSGCALVTPTCDPIDSHCQIGFKEGEGEGTGDRDDGGG